MTYCSPIEISFLRAGHEGDVWNSAAQFENAIAVEEAYPLRGPFLLRLTRQHRLGQCFTHRAANTSKILPRRRSKGCLLA